VLLSPQGARFDQRKAEELSARGRLVLVCGRYEGVDERVLSFVDEELSLGDFVLQGGEVAAVAVIEAVARLLPGVLGNEESAASESFAAEMVLEGPQYTRPPNSGARAFPRRCSAGTTPASRAGAGGRRSCAQEGTAPGPVREAPPVAEDLRLLEREEA